MGAAGSRISGRISGQSAEFASTAGRRAGVALAELSTKLAVATPRESGAVKVNARATIPTNVAEYREPVIGPPKAETRWRGMTAEVSGATISETSIPGPRDRPVPGPFGVGFSGSFPLNTSGKARSACPES